MNPNLPPDFLGDEIYASSFGSARRTDPGSGGSSSESIAQAIRELSRTLNASASTAAKTTKWTALLVIVLATPLFAHEGVLRLMELGLRGMAAAMMSAESAVREVREELSATRAQPAAQAASEAAVDGSSASAPPPPATAPAPPVVEPAPAPPATPAGAPSREPDDSERPTPATPSRIGYAEAIEFAAVDDSDHAERILSAHAGSRRLYEALQRNLQVFGFPFSDFLYVPLPRAGMHEEFEDLVRGDVHSLQFLVIHVPVEWTRNELEEHLDRWSAGTGVSRDRILAWSGTSPIMPKGTSCIVGGVCLIVTRYWTPQAFSDFRLWGEF